MLGERIFCNGVILSVTKWSRKISTFAFCAIFLVFAACTDYEAQIDDEYEAWLGQQEETRQEETCVNSLLLNETLDDKTVVNIRTYGYNVPVFFVMRKNTEGGLHIYGFYVDRFEEIYGAEYSFTGLLRDEYGNVVDTKLSRDDKVVFAFPYDSDFWNSDEFKQVQDTYAAQGIDKTTFDSLIAWSKKVTFYVTSSLGKRAMCPKSLEAWTNVSADSETCSTSIDMRKIF